MAKAPKETSYADAWRNFHNFVAQFGPHIDAISTALERAASVETYLADTSAAVATHEAAIKALDERIAAKKAELAAQEATLASNLQKYADAKQEASDALKDLSRQRTSMTLDHENFKNSLAEEKLALLTERDLVFDQVQTLKTELHNQNVQLAELQKRMAAANAALG